VTGDAVFVNSIDVPLTVENLIEAIVDFLLSFIVDVSACEPKTPVDV
jgi:hypothetical protein